MDFSIGDIVYICVFDNDGENFVYCIELKIDFEMLIKVN